jgi:subtilisin family serine protease
MDYSQTTLIVTFHARRKITRREDADSYLKNAKGYVRARHVYRFTNSVLAEVKAGQLDAFASDLINYDDVEFFEYNYILHPAAINECLGSWQPQSKWASRIAKDLHRLDYSPYAGIGVKIAMIDSGLSPHPYLPATSFFQASYFEMLWPEYVKGNAKAQADIDVIASLESSFPYPLSDGASLSDQQYFLSEAGRKIADISYEIWEDWLPQGIQWHSSAMSAYKQHMSQGGNKLATFKAPHLPKFPLTDWHGLYGQIRRISLGSRNFIADNLDITDRHGHGTQMAGIIFGRAGASLLEPNQAKRSELQRFEVDVIGVVPNAELLVLKCYDIDDIDNGTVDAMIRALEYAESENADVVYCGLAFDPGPRGITTKTAIALERTIDALSQANVAVVCPAGNGNKPELEFPAACSSAVAVTAVSLDMKGQVRLSDYSSHAGRREKVDFTAFGGDELLSVITTDLNFGFTQASGTSVAAAIAVGIISKDISKEYRLAREKEYNEAMYEAVRSGYTPSIPFLNPYDSKVSIRGLLNDIKSRADKTLFPTTTFPSSLYGYGLII